jgi:Flp pilus assembly protein TadD
MLSRYGWLALCGALFAGQLTGCVTLTGKGNRPNDPVGKASYTPAEREAPELPAPETARVCLATADTLFKAGKDREAIMLYEKARATDPSNQQVCRRLAVLYDRQGMHQQARDEYARALTLSPNDPDILKDLGYSCFMRGLLDDAELHLSKAVATDPKHQRAWTNLGLVLGHKGRYTESLQAFCQVVSAAQAYSNLGFLYTTQGKFAEAKASYRRALELESDMPKTREALARLESPAGEPVPEGKFSNKLESILGSTPEQPRREGTPRPATGRQSQPESQFVPAERPVDHQSGTR